MTEADAKDWITRQFGDAAVAKLARLTALVIEESAQQNLIAATSIETIWARHVVDSAQLISKAPTARTWLDIGTGAGFPGLVVATLTDISMVFVEPRRRRADFLQRSLGLLELHDQVSVRQQKVETLIQPADVISARAVGSLNALFGWAEQCGTARTTWLLPKGRNAATELAQAKRSWHGTFHVERSITDANSMIVIASGVARR